MPRVIIAGGTGLVGKKLVQLLIGTRFEIVVLTRSSSRYTNGIQYSCWDPGLQIIDTELFAGQYYIINLAGESIGAKRWSAYQKQHIVASRTEPAMLLEKTCAEAADKPLAVLSVSAIGIYGAQISPTVFSETAVPGIDFLANTCRQWEHASAAAGQHAKRSAILRLGIVLSADGGALTSMALPIKLFAGTYIGSGQQYISWIHIDDLCRWLVFCIENESIAGIYNVAAPDPVSNRDFTRILCRILRRPFIPAGIPGFLLRMVLGEMSSIVTTGSRVSVDKMQSTGFAYTYPDLSSALKALYPKINSLTSLREWFGSRSV